MDIEGSHSSTPEFLSKKHLNFGQGLEFLKFGQGNRGPNQQNRRKTLEKIRKNEENRRKFDKKFRDRDPYFLFKNFLFNIFSIRTLLRNRPDHPAGRRLLLPRLPSSGHGGAGLQPHPHKTDANKQQHIRL